MPDRTVLSGQTAEELIDVLSKAATTPAPKAKTCSCDYDHVYLCDLLPAERCQRKEAETNEP